MNCSQIHMKTLFENMKEIKKRIKKYCGLDVTDKDIITRFQAKMIMVNRF